MSEINVEILTDIIKNIKKDFDNYFNSECEYGIGYLDCLQESCEQVSIPCTRTENDLFIGE